MSDDHSPGGVTDADVRSLRAALERAANLNEQRNAAPFDGVMGLPPDWFPERHVREFQDARNRLLDSNRFGEAVTPDVVRQWIAAYKSWGEVEQPEFVAFVPPEVEHDVGLLANFQWIASLPIERGLVELAGKDALRGRRAREQNSANAKRPRKATEATRAEIEAFRADHVKQHGSEYGWAKAAARQFGLSERAIHRRIAT